MIETNFDFYHAAFLHSSVNFGGVFGERVEDLEVEVDEDCIRAQGLLVGRGGKKKAIAYATHFRPANVQYIRAAGQEGLSAAIPIDDSRCLSLFRLYSSLPNPLLARIHAWALIQVELRIVQPQDTAIMATMTEKSCVPGASRWVAADTGAARYVQWRKRRLQSESSHATAAISEAGT